MFNNIRVYDIKRADYKSGVIKLSDYKALADKLNKFMDITLPKREIERSSKRKSQKSTVIITQEDKNVK